MFYGASLTRFGLGAGISSAIFAGQQAIVWNIVVLQLEGGDR